MEEILKFFIGACKVSQLIILTFGTLLVHMKQIHK